MFVIKLIYMYIKVSYQIVFYEPYFNDDFIVCFQGKKTSEISKSIRFEPLRICMSYIKVQHFIEKSACYIIRITIYEHFFTKKINK